MLNKKLNELALLLVFLLFVSIFKFSLIAQAQTPSLYDRLGGIHAVASVIDDFIERLLADPVITKNEKVVSALGRISKPGLKYLVTEFVSQATGGPQKYTGRSMKDSHAHLDITEDEWNAAVKDLFASLDKFNVPKQEQNELVAIVATTKEDIVTAKPPTPAPVLAPQVAPQAELPTAPQEPPQAVPQAPPAVPPPQVLPKVQEAPQEAAPSGVVPTQVAPQAEIPDVVPQVPRVQVDAVTQPVTEPASDVVIPPPDVVPQVPVQPQTP